ncbi:energy-coupling factor transporter transmembrane component T [Staphylococcus aureus]|nr:energy-coupling factor transporter transmembrane component T [Staphylococcus aureus]
MFSFYYINIFLSFTINISLDVCTYLILYEISKNSIMVPNQRFNANIFLLIFTLMMHIFLTKGGYVLVEWHGITIETNGILEGLYISLRLIGIVMIATIMTLSTSPIDLTDAFERLLAPLKMFKLPVHQLSMIMSIALRFIPTLMDELDKIILAQKSRGSEISSGNIATRIKSFIPLLVPLFISAFQRAEELAVAMEVRVMMPMLRERATDSLNGN